METKTTVKITSAIQDLQFGYWEMETEEFIPIAGMDEEERQRAAELFGCSPVLVDALEMFAETVADVVGLDLRDIWKRLDAAGVK